MDKPITLALRRQRRQRQEDQKKKFKAFLVYITSLKLARAIRDLNLKKKKKILIAMTATPNLSKRHYIIHSIGRTFYVLCVIFPSWSFSGGRIGSRIQTGRPRTDCRPSG